jgi:hypothetical protein
MLNGTSCATCIEGSCCGQLQACLADQACKACFLDLKKNPDQCAEDNDNFSQIYACLNNACDSACTPIACDAPAQAPSNGSCVTLGGQLQCNPVTNQGCDASSGEACDFDGQKFICFPPPNDQPLCAACGQSDGWCAPGMTCVEATCARYCCDDGDCGLGVCVKGQVGPGVGYCASLPPAIPCEGAAPNGVCNPQKETCQCADCAPTALCVKDKCTTDGMCTVDDSCICPDCDDSPSCGCNYDGTCQSFIEGCSCSDCWDKAECADNPMDKCKDDGVCGATEYCVCVDCQPTGLCQDPNYCTDDGECVAYEGCHCNDCATEPTCPP